MPAWAIGEFPYCDTMTERTDPLELKDLLDAVRGGNDAVPSTNWQGWDDRLDQWVAAYPAFGAGRMLRAKTSRETRSLSAADCLAQAAVFSAAPGRLFDLMFRAGIEAEIASFARAVEALEPEVEDALKWKWHPEENPLDDKGADHEGQDGEERAGDVTPQTEGGEDPEEEAESPRPKVDVPEEGTLAREVLLGAIERSIERELDEVRQEKRSESVSESENEVHGKGGVRDSQQEVKPIANVDVAQLSPLARWAYERSQVTGFAEVAESRMPSEMLRRSAEKMEEVMDFSPELPSDAAGLDQQAALIDLFIRNEPTIGPVRPELEHTSVKELAKESLVEDASLITETMARIYAVQGQIGRARRAYKLLALKYPEKSVYFAAQSKKLGRKGADD
jgi:hypothetical protein